MSLSKIQWTEQTWNPVRGCSPVSPGCANCYAERMAGRFCGSGKPFEGFVQVGKNGNPGPHWTGKVELVEHMLDVPLRTRKPTTWFVNSMSDLFHEALPDEAIDRIFAVMALCPQHTFQVLTKRAGRMREYLRESLVDSRGLQEWGGAHLRVFMAMVNSLRNTDPHALNRASDFNEKLYPDGDGFMRRWPLPNIWLGVSVEDQQRADERIPDLLQTPAAVRFLSCEPLLGPVNLRPIAMDASGVIRDLVEWRRSRGEIVTDESIANYPPRYPIDALTGANPGGDPIPPIDWVIVGGESGPGARPMDIAWVRSIVQQCKAASVPVFVKQLGATPRDTVATAYIDPHLIGTAYRLMLRDKKGGSPEEWPEDLRVREMPILERVR